MFRKRKKKVGTNDERDFRVLPLNYKPEGKEGIEPSSRH